MIIGPDFVWLHFPKCAGTAVEGALRSLLANRPGIHFDPYDPAKVIWHHSVQHRERHDPSFSLGDRRVLCCFRRLPSWVLSRVHFEAARGPGFRTPTREMLLQGKFYEHDGILSSADEYAIKYSIPKVDKWIRTEHLVEDISAGFALEKEEVKAALRLANSNLFHYVKSVSFWFTDEELRGLYTANPVWAAIEQQVYGALLVSCPEALLANCSRYPMRRNGTLPMLDPISRWARALTAKGRSLARVFHWSSE